ncbi:MAG: methyltransferase domain-containing protein [Anaerolineales bacterium]|nr:methyltransferase domain-containing protein [Anaerolineales bacterium]
MTIAKDCPLCGANNSQFLENVDFQGQAYSYRICRHCGMMFLDHSLVEEELQIFYDHNYWKDPQNVERLARQFSRGQGIRRMLAVRGCAPRRVVDIGGGLGGVALGLTYGNDTQVHIIDRSLTARDQAERFGFKAYPDLDAFGDTRQLVDLVMFCHSLEHFPDPVQLIRDLQTRFGPETWLYIEVPNARWHPAAEVFHETMWTRRLAGRLAERTGLHVVDIWTGSSPWSQSMPIYLYLLARLGSGPERKEPTLPITRADVFWNRVDRLVIYPAYAAWNSLVRKIPVGSVRHRLTRQITNFDQSKLLIRDRLNSTLSTLDPRRAQ